MDENFIFRVLIIIEKVIWIHMGLGFVINSTIKTSAQIAKVSTWKDAKTSKITTRVKFEAVQCELCPICKLVMILIVKVMLFSLDLWFTNLYYCCRYCMAIY